MTAPILVFGWGNPSRGDDALGPLFVEHAAALNLPGVECQTDFQLQVEHALDLAGRDLVLFVDASVSAAAPFDLRRISPAGDANPGSHALSPETVLQVYVELHDDEPPPCFLLAIRGESFGLGTPCSESARLHLVTTLAWFKNWIKSRPVNF